METPWYVLLKDGKIGDQFSRENALQFKVSTEPLSEWERYCEKLARAKCSQSKPPRAFLI